MNSFTRTSVALAGGLFLAVAVPLAASAHVSLEDNTADAGSYTVITFKVPTESDTESTSSVTATIPASEGLGVRYVPVAGWTTEVTEGAESTTVTWTATAGNEIPPAAMQVFSLSLGAIPDTGSIVIPVSQTYTDGSVVDWADTEEDAELPAPVLYVNDAPAEDHHRGAAEEEAHEEAPAATDDVLARILGIGGLVVGAVGIVLAVTARRKA
jgi:uncharacterized protein YcnI